MKDKIRKKFLIIRQSIPNRDSKNELIKEKLLSAPEIIKAKIIHCYLSKEDEVETLKLIASFLTAKKKTIVPAISNNQIVSCTLNDLNDLKRSSFGILEPQQRQLYTGHLDIIIVPGIAFDKKGNRIGYGRGYYDRFLTSTQALKIGLAFEEQLLEFVPQEELDIKVDIIITDQRIIRI